ncbi:ABC transporter substrate-binding protein [Streptomyces sp. NBC_00878]|uniref:ABC transporter substrate-binding protein n=1 Tax=Streptomyces sp. NBC_00878 TaxID=2975854 RepID=UPI002258F562|nr:extracellular solute-binding protein [Streptomyces sp. NBC_00878]MCX4910679.1 extracellular solute-binding protein [Streptomyces sp. NBC_00878]
MVTSIAAVLATVIGTASCSTMDTVEGDNVLTLVASGEDPARAVIAEFEKANPGIRVRAVFTEDDGAYSQQIRTQLAAGTAPDVFRIWPGNGGSVSVGALSEQGLLSPLTGAPWEKKLTEGQRTVSADADGNLVALPVTIGGIGAIWNDQALADTGLTKPTTWSELLKLCADARRQGKVALALGQKDSWVGQLVPYALSASLVYGRDPGFAERQQQGRADFQDSAWRQTLNKYLSLRDHDCFNDSPNGTGYDEQMAMVGTGKALGAVHVTQAVGAAKEKATKGTTFSLSPLPATDDPGQTRVPVAVGISYAVNAKAHRPELARKFIDFLATEQAQATYAKVSGNAPALPSPDFKEDAVSGPVLAAQRDGRSTGYPDQSWPSPKIQQEMLIGLQELMSGAVDSGDLLRRMDDVYRRTR